MDKLIALQQLIENTHCKIRLKVYREDLATEWRGGFGVPVKGYIEVTGPERLRDVDWVELDPIIVNYVGRLVPPKVTVATDDIIQVLDNVGIDWQTVKGMIRIDGCELR